MATVRAQTSYDEGNAILGDFEITRRMPEALRVESLEQFAGQFQPLVPVLGGRNLFDPKICREHSIPPLTGHGEA